MFVSLGKRGGGGWVGGNEHVHWNGIETNYILSQVLALKKNTFDDKLYGKNYEQTMCQSHKSVC